MALYIIYTMHMFEKGKNIMDVLHGTCTFIENDYLMLFNIDIGIKMHEAATAITDVETARHSTVLKIYRVSFI